MTCKFCEERETKNKFRNISCCRDCRPKIYEKRDELKQTKKDLEIESTINPKEKMLEFYMAPEGTITTAIEALLTKEKEDGEEE